MPNRLLPALAACLALGAVPAFAQGYPPPPMQQPPVQTVSHEWAGGSLRYTPSNTSGCRMEVVRVFVRSGTIFAAMRNAGDGTRNLTLSANLAGGNNSKGGNGSSRLNAGQTREVQLMTPYGGTLVGSTMTLRATACAPA